MAQAGGPPGAINHTQMNRLYLEAAFESYQAFMAVYIQVANSNHVNKEAQLQMIQLRINEKKLSYNNDFDRMATCCSHCQNALANFQRL